MAARSGPTHRHVGPGIGIGDVVDEGDYRRSDPRLPVTLAGRIGLAPFAGLVTDLERMVDERGGRRHGPV